MTDIAVTCRLESSVAEKLRAEARGLREEAEEQRELGLQRQRSAARHLATAETMEKRAADYDAAAAKLDATSGAEQS